MLLQDKVAVITGGSAGMGKAIVKKYLQEGAYVIATGRRAEKLEQLREEAAQKDHLFLVPGDVSEKGDVNALLDFVKEKFGRLDILVNNAGIMDNMAPVGDVSDEQWDQLLAVNLTGPFLLCCAGVNLMLQQETRGVIVNIASGGGIGGGRSGAAYVASKFGLVGLSKNIAYMYAPDGIRCNIICPGAVETEIGNTMKNIHALGAKRVSEGVKNITMGKPDEIADLAVFLASAQSSFINGATVVADGGKGAW